MKTLQNNFTTVEQSKELLKLGLPEDSADLMYYRLVRDKLGTPVDYPFDLHVPGVYALEGYERVERMPCWSAGRLIEIYTICRECTWEYITNNPVIEDILHDIELHIDELNFSKLDK